MRAFGLTQGLLPLLGEHVVHEDLGGLLVFRALEGCNGSGGPGDHVLGIESGDRELILHGKGTAGHGQDSDAELTGGTLGARLAAALGVEVHILIDAAPDFPALLLAIGLDGAVEDGVLGAGDGGRGHNDLALVFRLGQILPGFGGLQVALGEDVVVDQEAGGDQSQAVQ